MSTQTPERCVVTFVVSPGKFYIATPEMRAEQERIAESMWNEFTAATPMNTGERLSAADLAVVYHKGKFWRASKLNKHCDGVSVFLVDRGEFVVVDRKKVFALDLGHPLRQIDPLCVRAHLGDVIPARSDEWSQESCDFFARNVRREDLKAILRGDIEKRKDGELSMPLKLLFTESFTETPFHPVKRIETSMARLLLSEGHATVSCTWGDQDPDGNLTVPNGERELEKTKWEPIQKGPPVLRWLPPLIPEIPLTRDLEEYLKVRITHVDGALQLYGHLRGDRPIITAMKVYFSTCELEEDEDDVKETWSVGDACVARLGDDWYRAQVIEVNGTDAAVVFVDLGNVRRIAKRNLRVPRAYGDQPILAFRMVLDNVVAPDDRTSFSERTITEIEKELVYWKAAKTVRVVRSRKEAPRFFPVPIVLFRRQKTQRVPSDVEGQVEEVWEDYGDGLVTRGMAAYGAVGLDSASYSQYARGIEPDVPPLPPIPE